MTENQLPVLRVPGNPSGVFEVAVQTAVEDVIVAYASGGITIETEADLQGHLFARLVALLPGSPLPLHACRSIGTPREKPDLVIGDKEIIVELKVEADYPGVSKLVVSPEEVWKDLQRLNRYVREGIVRSGYFLMLDEDGSHARRSEAKGLWREAKRADRKASWLYLKFPST